MPNFPTYNSKRNVNQVQISAEPTAPQRTGSGAEYEAAGNTLEAAAGILQKWDATVDTMDYTTFKSNTETAIAQQKILAANDPDPNNAQSHFKALQDVKKNALNVFHNKQLAQKSAIELDHSIGVASLEIGAEFKKKQIFQNKINLSNTLDILYKEKSAALTPVMAGQTQQKINDLITANYANGTITESEANKFYTDAKIMPVKYDIYNDTAQHEKDSQVLKDLRAGDKGPYAFLSPKERLDLMEESQRRIFQNNQTFKRDIEVSQNERHDDVLDKISKGTLTYADIDRELAIPVEQGGVPRKILVSYQKALGTAIDSDLKQLTTEKTVQGKLTPRAIKAKNYLKMIDNFIDDKVDVWKAREALADVYADGIVNPKEAVFLNKLTYSLEDIEWNRRSDFIKKSIDWFKGGNQNLSDEQLAIKIKGLINSFASNYNPEAAFNDFIKKDNKENRPEITTHGAKGQIMIDKDGNKAKVYPDGTIEEL